MMSATDDNRERAPIGVQRRRLLSAAAGMAAALVGCGREGPDVQARDAAPQPPRPAGADTPGKSRVVVVRSEEALDEDGCVNDGVVGAMLETAMLKTSGAPSLEDAWRAYVQPRDVVGVKVNCLGGPSLCTHPALVDHMADGMQRAGVPAGSIIIYDRETGELEECGFTVRERGGVRCYGTDAVGYDPDWTVIGSTGSRFSAIATRQCSAIVNAPILKDHDGAGVTCALKNHFGSINNPNKLHTDHCDPHIANINCAPALRDKQRISICDALLVCYEGGPGFKPETTVPYGAILVSTDPVALDTVGFGIIEELREASGLEPIAAQERAPTYIATAADEEHRLGANRLEDIELVEATVTA
ncbi:MAG: DUF362 domain-containing protein [Armatimonadota bacterium]